MRGREMEKKKESWREKISEMKVSETNLISSLAGWSIEEPKDLL